MTSKNYYLNPKGKETEANPTGLPSIGDSYRRLAYNISTIKHSKKATDKNPLKVCLWCGSFFRSTSPLSTHCTYTCAVSHVHHPSPNPSTTSWCAEGNQFTNDEYFSRTRCPDPLCLCRTYTLIKAKSLLHRCIICGRTFFSLRNPLICSQACAITFNQIPSRSKRQLLPHIYEKLNAAKTDIEFLTLIVRDLDPSSPKYQSFGRSADPYNLIDYADELSKPQTQSQLATLETKLTGYRLAINQYVYQSIPTITQIKHHIEINTENTLETTNYETQTYILYTLRATNKPIHNKTPHPIISTNPDLLPKAQSIIATQITTTPNLPRLNDLHLTAIANRILYVSQPIQLLKDNLKIHSSHLPHINLYNSKIPLYTLTPTDLTTHISRIIELHGHCNPKHYNCPIFFPKLTTLPFIPALPSYDPTTKTFITTTDIPLAKGKTTYTTLSEFLENTNHTPPPVNTLYTNH